MFQREGHSDLVARQLWDTGVCASYRVPTVNYGRHYVIGQAIIFLPCGFFLSSSSLWPPYVIGQAIYIFILWFLLMVALCNRADHYIFIL